MLRNKYSETSKKSTDLKLEVTRMLDVGIYVKGGSFSVYPCFQQSARYTSIQKTKLVNVKPKLL